MISYYILLTKFVTIYVLKLEYRQKRILPPQGRGTFRRKYIKYELKQLKRCLGIYHLKELIGLLELARFLYYLKV